MDGGSGGARVVSLFHAATGTAPGDRVEFEEGGPA